MLWISVALLTLVIPTGFPAAPQEPSRWQRQLRFSPDGQYILAQDDKEITVLAARPLEVLLRFPSERATLAQFTPDSKRVVFVSSIPRIDQQHVGIRNEEAHLEQWSVADHRRTLFTEVPLENCETVALSPDGRTVGCDDLEGTPRLIDASSGETVFTKKHFARRDYLGTIETPCYEERKLPRAIWAQDGVKLSPNCYAGDAGLAIFGFSPDSRFVIAEPVFQGAAIAWDISNRRRVPLAGGLRELRKSTQVSYPLPFTFVAPDLVLLYRPGRWKMERDDHIERLELVSFPSGTVVSEAHLPMTPGVFPTADPSFVLVRPLDGPAAAAVNFRSGKEIITSQQPALDVLGPYYVAEPNPGEVGLYERGKGLQAAVRLH